MIALLWALGCRTPPCTADGCALGESCQDGECVARVCATSTQCPLDHHCSKDGQCVAGCTADTDCAPGSSCGAEGACVTSACEDATLDCAWREWCQDGTCTDAGEPYCEACLTDPECGDGNICWAEQWCGVDCSETGACPGGFTCVAVDHTDGLRHEICLAACWLPR